MTHDTFHAGDVTAVIGDNSAAGEHRAGYNGVWSLPHVFAHGYIGLFWASYINAPADKSIYFRGGGLWQQLCSQRHNDESTVRHRDDRIELRFSPDLSDALYRNFSPLRFDESYYYGLF